VNEEQLLELRLWAGRLASDARADVRAAAKAIVMLVDELEALRAERPQPNDALEAGAETAPVAAHAEVEIGSAFRGRLRSLARKRLSTHEGRPLSQKQPGDTPL
jgi:hypothetical protein